MDPPYPKPRSYGPHPKMAADPPLPPPPPAPPQHSDNDRTLDCNLSALCNHVQIEGFNSGSFSDIAVHAMGSTYHLHRLILSRSSYFRLVRKIGSEDLQLWLSRSVVL